MRENEGEREAEAEGARMWTFISFGYGYQKVAKLK